MSEEEFGEVLALANTLPGPIATKMAAYIGYKVKGNIGAVVAILTHVLPSVIAMLGLLGVLYSFSHSPIVGGMVQGVTPVIGFMLAEMAYRFSKTAKRFGFTKDVIVLGHFFHPNSVGRTSSRNLNCHFFNFSLFIASRKEKAANTPPKDVIELKEKSS